MDLEIIEKVKFFLEKANIDKELKGICIITIGIDKK